MINAVAGKELAVPSTTSFMSFSKENSIRRYEAKVGATIGQAEVFMYNG